MNDFVPLFITCDSNKVYVAATIPYSLWQDLVGQYLIIYNPRIVIMQDFDSSVTGALLLEQPSSFQIVSSCPSSCPLLIDVPSPTVLRRCPYGVGPNSITAGDYDPNKLTQQEKQWLWGIFGHAGIAPVGYGGQQCTKGNKLAPTLPPTPTSVPSPMALRPCPLGVGPNGITPGDYDPNKLIQQEKQWLWEIFGHSGFAPVGYGGEKCTSGSDIIPTQTDYRFCAEEGQRCEFSGTKDVFYGANGKNAYAFNITGGIDCNNRIFGDPNPGVHKRCYIKDSIGPTYLEPAKAHWTKSKGAVYKYSSNCFAFGGTFDEICDIYEIHIGWNYVDANGNEQVGWARDANDNVVKIPLRDYLVISQSPAKRLSFYGVPSTILAAPEYPWWIDYPPAP